MNKKHINLLTNKTYMNELPIDIFFLSAILKKVRLCESVD